MLNNNFITISKASKLLGVSKDTLRRWEKKKIIKPFRSPSGWRYYDLKQLNYVYNQKPDLNNFQSKTREDKSLLIPPLNNFVKKEIKESITHKNLNHSKFIFLLIFLITLNAVLLLFYTIVSK